MRNIMSTTSNSECIIKHSGFDNLVNHLKDEIEDIIQGRNFTSMAEL